MRGEGASGTGNEGRGRYVASDSLSLEGRGVAAPPATR